MVVGFVNSGMMKVRQAIGVVMGAIIGTSITGWIICLSDIGGGSSGWLELLSTDTLTAVIAVIGIVLRMFCSAPTKKHVGEIMLGFAVLMFGMKAMSSSVYDLRSSETFINMLTTFSNPILGIALGIVFTSVIQSASAAVGILQALAITGAIRFDIALPIIMGIAIGAAVPVLLSALGASADGKRTALSYLMVDTLGVVITALVFYTLNAIFDFSFMSMTMTTVSLALMNTVFRFVIVAILAPFIRLLEKICKLIIKDKPEDAAVLEDFDRLEERFLDHPALAVEQSRLTVNSMAKKARENLFDAFALIDNYSDDGFAHVTDTEDIVDYSCAEDCCTDFTFQLAHLTQGLDGDRNRGSGQNDTDESSLQHVHRVGRIIVERQIACNTTDQRHDNTDQRDNEGRKTGGFQLIQISIHTCVKHQDDYTDLSGLYQKIGLAYPAEAARANQHAGNQCTDNLRHMHALRSKAEYLCEQHDDRNRQQKVI